MFVSGHMYVRMYLVGKGVCEVVKEGKKSVSLSLMCVYETE